MHRDPLLVHVGGVTKLSSRHYTEAAYGGLLTDVLGFALERVLSVAEPDVFFSVIN